MKAGADLKARTSLGSASLHLAAQSGHKDVTMALLKAGADLEARNSLAALVTSQMLVRALIDQGANSDTRFPWGTTLDVVDNSLREKKVNGKVATEEQLHRLEGIRRCCAWRQSAQCHGYGPVMPPSSMLPQILRKGTAVTPLPPR